MRFLLSLLLITILASACSVPTLESKSCLDAQASLKKLLSIHFDRGFNGNDAYRKERDGYITDRLKGEIDAEKGFDYLTQTKDYPKAFRIGGCTEEGENSVTLDALLFWKDDKRDEQRKIYFTMKNVGNKWLVDKAAEGN